MGGIQFPYLTEITKTLWQWCEQRNIYVFASYIRSSDNIEADAESRRIHPDIEWELSDTSFRKIVNAFGCPEIDLFASRINTKCSRYISWHRDPDAEAVNAFTVDWSSCFFYAFPPFSMVLKTLRKILEDKGRGIMVVPFWPTQPWYPLFKSLHSTNINFLVKLYKDEGAQYGTLNCCRSALALIIGEHVGLDESIKRFFKGIYRLRPPRAKYDTTWDVSLVLNFLENLYPNESLSLEDISKKLITLLALVTAHRAQTFSKISIDYISRTDSQMRIKITDLIKTSRVGSQQPVLILPFFNQKPAICPARTLLYYLKVTSSLRGTSKGLFIGLKKPHGSVSSQTLSRWIRSTLMASGVDVAAYGAHSARHAATSAALRSGVSLDAIRRAAGWTASSETFFRFYNRPLDGNTLDDSFARAIMGET
ncbi:hypothetical protein HF086_013002 [Spodoptera exigua]|uniref:Tyr recombinase domain-containing protein n=1 Tax=Spodoptera exigua TaxID=7107 RepID=A0A922MR74_SPOEX|nr:hypothetical protein HF086_013002 [Spodoptera exigua]